LRKPQFLKTAPSADGFLGQNNPVTRVQAGTCKRRQVVSLFNHLRPSELGLGVKLGDIIPPEAVEEVNLQFFNGKSVAIDGFNALYQFLATIRGPDGRPLMDSRGRVTSHLSGLFFRTLNLLEENVKVVYVFDGQPPELKKETIRKRVEAKKVAAEKYEQASRRETSRLRGNTRARRRPSRSTCSSLQRSCWRRWASPT